MHHFFSVTSLLLMSVFALSIPVVTKAQIIDPRPICEAVGSLSEGWYQSGIRIDFAQCEGCLSYCAYENSLQEGWYNWCDKTLITLDRCSNELHSFTDVPERHPLYTPIRHAVNLGVVEGYAVHRADRIAWEYRPNALISRAEFTKMIVTAKENRDRLKKCPSTSFSDVDYAAWYIPSLCVAEEEGIIRGYPDGSFQPDRTISFAEAAIVFIRAFGWFDFTPVTADPWYRGPIDALATQNAIPLSIASFEHKLTRGEMADILYRLQVFDPDRTTLTYDDLLRLSMPASSSAASSSVAASAPSLPRTRVPSSDGLFSLEVPSRWQAMQLDGTQVAMTQLDPVFAFYGSPAAGDPELIIEVFHAEALQKPETESFFDFLRRTVLPPVDDAAIETVAFADGTMHQLHLPAESGGTGGYYVFFVRGDSAVLLVFPTDDRTATDTVASFQWIVSSSSSLQ